MGLWFAMVIPVIVSLVLLIKFNKKVVWWEFLILFGVSPILILLFSMGAESSMTRDTEFWGSYITSAKYFEAWNERVSCRHPKYRTETYRGSDGKTKTRQVQDGYKHWYDVDEHSEKWVMYDSNNSSFRISSDKFEKFSRDWGNRRFKDMHRDYHTRDGDCYVTTFNGDDKKLEPVVQKKTYENRVQSSSSVFNFPELSDEDIASYGLFKYPTSSMYVPSYLGKELPNHNAGNHILDVYNAKNGKRKQVRVWVVVFDNKSMESGVNQENLWKGGNKNEFVVCLSVDKDNRPQWCRSFTWSEVDALKINVNSFVMSMEKVDAVELSNYISSEVDKLFIRKEFADFEYIDVDLPASAYLITYLFTLIVNIGLAVFVVKNDIEEDKIKRRRK